MAGGGAVCADASAIFFTSVFTLVEGFAWVFGSKGGFSPLEISFLTKEIKEKDILFAKNYLKKQKGVSLSKLFWLQILKFMLLPRQLSPTKKRH